MKHEAVMEFYLKGKLIAFCKSEVEPPPVGGVISIRRIDYLVRNLDYSLDQPESGPIVFRRNVHLSQIEIKP